MSRLLCCTTSGGARCHAQSYAEGADASHERGARAVREKLEATGLTALQRRAADEGVDGIRLAEAVDSDHPKAAVIALILERQHPCATLRDELRGLGLTALQKRAAEDGVDEVAVESAVDGDGPKDALLELILARHEEIVGQRLVAPVITHELQSLGLSALQKRALDAGADQVAIDRVLDSDMPKPGLIGLIVDAGESELETARNELQDLGLAALQKLAADRGISAAEIDEAIDADEPKPALIGVLLSRSTLARAPAPATTRQHAATDKRATPVQLRQELQGMKLLALQRQASELRADETQLETAMESDDPKAAMVELILQIQQRSEATAAHKSKPHFGALPSVGNASPVPAPTDKRRTKHVMLSYQWDHQKQVQRVHSLLTNLGLTVWMDVNGGMGMDVYESMAEGVSNASAVVCFMTQQYQESPNCMLEAKFAKQSGVEIVPVVLEGGGWKASGWLGLVTAGSLWTPLHDPNDFDENVGQLHRQLLKIVGNTVAADEDVGAHEAKEELERLRDSQTATQSTVAMVLADPSQPATIPAGVPKLPCRFHGTSEIQTLTQLVLSTSSADMAKPRIGFFGMGGIGKTVTGAAIVRNDAVRLHFDAIVWLPIGQTPMIAKLQNLCHMQCTGNEVSADLSSDERKQALQQAMAGKKILLCLDDLWDEVHETELNFADVDAGSKVLISTRMKGLLAGGHQVEVGLPSVADAARMLLAAAEVEDASAAAPTGVLEIVDLCGRLPLALGIAGRLAASLGLVGTQDWSGMIGVLKEELCEVHSGGTEEGMIRASLKGLKGSLSEQDNVKALLKLFAIVPEDTYCPLQVLLLMFKAVNDNSSATIMHIRKWLRVLIDRSLVLGTVDRPSVHDLVLDFAVAQHKTEELRQNHCKVVEAFRVARPTDAQGRCKFTPALRHDALCSYVCSEVSYHLNGGWYDSVGITWASDVPQDEIVVAAGHIMGLEKLEAAALRADAAGDSWLASRYWSLASILAWKTVDQEAGRHPAKQCLDACTKVLACQDLKEATRDDVYEVQLDRYLALAMLLDVPFLNARAAEVEELGRSSAGVVDPLGVAILKFVAVAVPLMFSGDVRGFGAAIADQLWAVLVTGMNTHSDPSVRYFCSMQSFNSNHLLDAVLLSKGTYDWEAHYSPGAEFFMETIRAYDYDRVHVSLRERFNADHVMISPHAMLPVALHFGAIQHCREYIDRVLVMWQRVLDEPNQQPETLGYAFAFPTWAYIVAVVPGVITPAQQATIAGLFGSLGLTWATIDEETQGYGKGLIRQRGATEMNVTYMTAEQVAWLTKAAYILVTPRPVVTKAEVLAFLPSVETVISGVCNSDFGSISHATSTGFNTFLILAHVSEKFELWPQVLEYAQATMDPDLKKAGSEAPLMLTNAWLLTGRAHSALGRATAAAESFEAAAKLAHSSEMWTLEALALRDLKSCVLDGMGHGDYGARRLGQVLRMLTGPVKLLTSLLQGSDAVKLMMCAAPQPGYEVTYAPSPPVEVVAAATAEDGTTAKLRCELHGMRMSALQQRAVDCGIEASKLDDALESGSPKHALTQLVLEHHRVSQQQHSDHAKQQNEQLRDELAGLRMMGLQQRALSEGVDPKQLDDAMDSGCPKDAVIALLMAIPATVARTRDGYGGELAEGVPPSTQRR